MAVQFFSFNNFLQVSFEYFYDREVCRKVCMIDSKKNVPHNHHFLHLRSLKGGRNGIDCGETLFAVGKDRRAAEKNAFKTTDFNML